LTQFLLASPASREGEKATLLPKLLLVSPTLFNCLSVSDEVRNRSFPLPVLKLARFLDGDRVICVFVPEITRYHCYLIGGWAYDVGNCSFSTVQNEYPLAS
jgi:hypothetical protein